MRRRLRLSVPVVLLALGVAFAVTGWAGARSAGPPPGGWNLTGIWTGDNDDSVYTIKQSGSTVTWFAHSGPSSTCTWMNDFTGTLSGDFVSGNWKDRAEGTCAQAKGYLKLQVIDAMHMKLDPASSSTFGTKSWTRQTAPPPGTTPGPTPGPTPGCTITGTPGPDKLVGTPGPDVICGGPGNDTLIGGGGNDRLVGGPGNNVLDGGPGNDVLYGGPGKDKLLGGPGNDTLYARDGKKDVLVDGGPGKDKARIDNGVDPVKSIEKLF